MIDGIIIGGGASGLICGIEAARRGKHCIIIEQKEKAGKKLYATGNGKCNFANRQLGENRYHSVEESGMEQIAQVITDETCASVETFFKEIGVPNVERQGYLYPRSEQATALVHALEQVFLQYHGKLVCSERVDRLQFIKERNVFQVKSGNHEYIGKKLVLATGGMAASHLGSDGSGYVLAKQLGHKVTACVPALCGLKCKERGWNRLQGVRAKGTVRLWQNNRQMGEDSGEIQFTQYGVSGIVIFNLARYASLGLRNNQTVWLELDLLPDYTSKELLQELLDLQKSCGYRRCIDILAGFLPEKLAMYVMEQCKIAMDNQLADVSDKSISQIVANVKQMRIQIIDTNTFEQAQVTAGGVSLQEIHMETMESKIQPGCYLTGELLDADGDCGGYNLMWAWETGRRAGRNL